MPPARKPDTEDEVVELQDDLVDEKPPPAAKDEEPAVEEAPAISTDEFVDIVARLSPDQVSRLRNELGIKGHPDDPSTPASPPPVPLHTQASFNPVDIAATKDMKAADAAKKLGVKLDDLLGFSVRAPLNLDDAPIGEKGVLTGVLSNGDKISTEYAY